MGLLVFQCLDVLVVFAPFETLARGGGKTTVAAPARMPVKKTIRKVCINI